MRSIIKRRANISFNLLLVVVLSCLTTAIYATETIATPANGSPMTVKSKISAVTIFMDRALVTRTAVLTLNPGDYQLLFDDLPENIISQSLQVDGKGDFLLKQFQYREKTTSDDSGAKKIADLRAQIKTLRFQIKQMEDKIQQTEKEMQFFERIIDKITESNSKAEKSEEMDPDKWMKMVSFYHTKLDALLKDSRDAEQQKEDNQEEINRLEREINNTNASSVTEKYHVELSVLVKSAGPIRLDLSYLVTEAAWIPGYDLRVSSEKKIMTVVYNAVVQQNTSEDWTDVELGFSTAKPNIASKHPDLQRWSVDFYTPPPVPTQSKVAPGSQSQAMQQQFQPANMTNVYQEVVYNVDGLKTQASASKLDSEARKRQQEFRSEMEKLESEIEDKSISVVFAIPGKNTIKSDNVPHKLTIMTRELPAYFRYSTAPKLMKAAFLKARVKNTSDYPILPGEYNVFLNNAFITTSRMGFKSPSEEFWTFLGMDEGIKVEYKSKEKYKDSSAFLGKTTSNLIYENLVTITNNKKTEIEIVIWDQLPISNNKEITVELLEPKQINNTSLKKTDNDFLEWMYKIKPGEKLEIPLKFAIQYPKGREIKAR
jgi:uncharacterized protein (TIGR02231 family)